MRWSRRRQDVHDADQKHDRLVLFEEDAEFAKDGVNAVQARNLGKIEAPKGPIAESFAKSPPPSRPQITHAPRAISGLVTHAQQSILQTVLQLSLYKKKAGVFDSKNAILFSPEALKANPHAWWDDWGSGKKEVHDFAVRVHAQPTGIGMAERCWKAYSYIHNAKRNRMCSTRACKLVRTHYNLRLISKRKNPRYEEEHLAGLEIESELNTYEESP